MSALILSAAILFPASAAGASEGSAPSRQPESGWRRMPLGANAWQGYTHAVVVGQDVWFFHGRAADVLRSDDSWAHHPDLLPHPVDFLSAVCVYDDRRIAIVPGRGLPGLLLDTERHTCAELAGLSLQTGRGARIYGDGSGGLFCMVGGGRRGFYYHRNGRLLELPEVETVSAPGKYSSGLVRMGHRLLAFGDHHVSVFDPIKMQWEGPRTAPRLFKVMGFRPALDRGGMVFQDPETSAVYVTLGKDARTIGVLLANARFHYLSPRLPFGLRDSGRTLFVRPSPEGPRLCLLSQLEAALFWIPIAELTLVDLKDRAVEPGSRWVSWNSWEIGARGDLVRERDSTANVLFLDPWIFAHRKNSMRTIDYDRWRHSPWAGSPQFGKRFATKGAAICTDGRRIYVFDGTSTDFYCLELFVDREGKSSQEMLPINRALVRKLAPLDPFPAGSRNDDPPRNRTMVCHGGKVFVLPDPVTRTLHSYDPEKNRWQAETLIPSAVHYSDELGVDLMTDGERLWLLGASELTSYVPGAGWTEVVPLGFQYSADGGMAIFDPVEGWIYVALGGRSRDLAVVDPRHGEHRIYRDFFPDAVSVHGRRLFLTERDGVRYLNIQRGHDSSEFWRTAISGDGRLQPR